MIADKNIMDENIMQAGTVKEDNLKTGNIDSGDVMVDLFIFLKDVNLNSKIFANIKCLINPVTRARPDQGGVWRQELHQGGRHCRQGGQGEGRHPEEAEHERAEGEQGEKHDEGQGR